jgi:hypothetical protein
VREVNRVRERERERERYCVKICNESAFVLSKINVNIHIKGTFRPSKGRKKNPNIYQYMIVRVWRLLQKRLSFTTI